MGRLQHIFIIDIVIVIAGFSGIIKNKMIPCIKIILDFLFV